MPRQAPRHPARSWSALARGARTGLCLWLVGASSPLWAQAVLEARFVEPTNRYPHGVLGDTIEWGALELSLSDATRVVHTLPDTRVFEDLAPRLIDLDGDGKLEAIVVESDQTTGASLAVYGPTGKTATTPNIGTRFRWLAPVGAADLDGDGHVEIAYVDRPHLAKVLRIWRFQNGALTEIATLPGLTNHRIGEDFISGGLRDCGNRPELILVSADWSRITGVSYDAAWQKTDLGPYSGANSLTNALSC